jgi:Fe-S-cluster-containing dehydrogenase component
MEDTSRRTFLKVAGATLLGSASVPLLSAIARERVMAAPGSRLAMVVDLKRCMRNKGCTDCIAACHHVHNVPNVARPEFGLKPEEIQKREIKWIWKESFNHAFPDDEREHIKEDLKGLPVPILCNHCENPPCVRVCPTQATWKRKQDGIVMMDMHRCIGCRYCVVACPYGSRSFNWRNPREFFPNPTDIDPGYPTRTKGVVEKCTFCEERVSEGLKPACVEACKYRALFFGDIEDPTTEVSRILRLQFTIRRKPGLGTNPQIYYVV